MRVSDFKFELFKMQNNRLHIEFLWDINYLGEIFLKGQALGVGIISNDMLHNATIGANIVYK